MRIENDKCTPNTNSYVKENVENIEAGILKIFKNTQTRPQNSKLLLVKKYVCTIYDPVMIEPHVQILFANQFSVIRSYFFVLELGI